MLYRILTENKNLDGIIRIIGDDYAGFTIIHTIGYWKGEKENGLTIEIDSDKPNDEYCINNLVKRIKILNQQEAVLVQKIECETYFI